MATGDLTTLEAVRSLLGLVDDSQTGSDDEIETCITAASRAIHVYTAQEFATTTGGVSYTRAYRYEGGCKLSLQPYSLRSVEVVEIDRETDDPVELEENSDFYLMPRSSMVDGGVFDSLEMQVAAPSSSKGWSEVWVTGIWGYATIPDDVSRAAALLAAWWYRNQSTVPGVSLGGEGDRFGPVAWPTGVLQLLAPYRIIGFGSGA